MLLEAQSNQKATGCLNFFGCSSYSYSQLAVCSTESELISMNVSCIWNDPCMHYAGGRAGPHVSYGILTRHVT